MLSGSLLNFVLYLVWLGKLFLFQTFDELDGVKDKETDVRRICLLLEGENRKENIW